MRPKKYFTQIPNALMETLIRSPLLKLKPKLIIFFIRETFGFGREDVSYSLDNISRRVHYAKSHVCSEINALIGLEIIHRRPHKGRKAASYTLAPFESWNLPGWSGLPKPERLPIPEHNITDPQTLHSHSQNSIPSSLKKPLKETIKRNPERQTFNFVITEKDKKCLERLGLSEKVFTKARNILPIDDVREILAKMHERDITDPNGYLISASKYNAHELAVRDVDKKWEKEKKQLASDAPMALRNLKLPNFIKSNVDNKNQ